MAKVRFLEEDSVAGDGALSIGRVRFLDEPGSPPPGRSGPIVPRPSGAAPLNLSRIPIGKRTHVVLSRRAGQGQLPINPRGLLLSAPRAAETPEAAEPQPFGTGFDPSSFTPDLLARLDEIDAGARASDLVSRPGPTQQAAILAEYEQADPGRRATLRREYMEVVSGRRDPRPLAQRIREYEQKNSFLTRIGQRLESGTYGALQSVAAMRAADLASYNPELSSLLDQIDVGKHPRELALPAGPSTLRDLVNEYYGADAESRAELRQAYADDFAKQVGRAVEYGQRSAAIPRNPVVEATTDAMNVGEFGKAWDAFSTDPLGFIAQVGVESFPRSVPGLAATPFVGPVAAFGATSAASEYGTAIVQGLQDAGVDVGSPQAVMAAMQDPALMESVRGNAMKRALVVGAFEAASGGLAGRTLAPGTLSPVARHVVNLPVQSVTQGALGAAGEAGAQVATGQHLRLGDVAAEFAGEFVSAPADVAAAGLDLRRQRVRFLPDAPELNLRAAAAPAGEPGGPSPTSGLIPPAPSPEAPQAVPVELRRTFTEGGTVIPTEFPDAQHAALFDYGLELEVADRTGARKPDLPADLYRHFVGYVEGLDSPAGVEDLARDYVAEVRGVGRTAVTARGASAHRADAVIDPDLAVKYWQRGGTFPFGGAAAPQPGRPTPTTFTPAPVSVSSAGPQQAAVSPPQSAAGQQRGVTGGSVPPTGSAPATLPDAFTPNAQTGGDLVVTPGGRRLNVEYQVVDAGSLLTSDMGSYPAELQPRDRTRAASQAQIAQIAGNIQPELLGRSSDATSGAPIVGPDMAVESGNGRVLALRQAYSQGRAEGYRQWLRSQGFNVDSMTAPVLVRVRQTQLSPRERVAFTVESNQRNTLSMGAAEQAMTDARAMSPALIDAYSGGDISAAVNRNFVRGFVSMLPPSEQGAVIGPDGALSQDGLRRIENAVFARAYGDPRILAALREDSDSNIKSIGGAMVDAAPGWMKLRADVGAGRARQEMDITAALVEAVNLVARSRREGVLLADIVNQRDMFGQGASPLAQAILRLMFSDDKMRRPVSRQRLASVLTFYADQARKAAEGGLALGDTHATPQSILGLARNRGTGELFGTMPDVAEMRSGGRAEAAPTEAEAVNIVDAHMPPIETLDDLRAILDRNVAAGTLSKEAAADIKAVVARFPHNALRGVRVLIQKSVPRDLSAELSLNLLDKVLFRGSVIPYEGGETVLFVPDRRSGKTTGETFAHENGHLIYDRLMTDADRAEARRIYDSLRVSRQSVFTANYFLFTGPRNVGEVRFQEWFAESFADWVNSRVKMKQRRKLAPTLIDDLFNRLWKRVIDLFSNEKKLVDAFIDGLDQRLRIVTGTGPALPAAPQTTTQPATVADTIRSIASGEMPEVAQMAPGANYVGAAPQIFNPAVPRSTAGPLRREAILRDLVKALGMPLYAGRIRSPKTLGFFRKGVEEIRIKQAADIETAAHEIAHYLDKKFPEIRKQWHPATNANATIRAELSGVSYDKTKLYEGFAEFIRLWATQTNQARAKAPDFFAWWEGFVNRNQHGPALRKMQADMTAWFEQSALDRARSKIGTPPVVNDALNNIWGRVRQSIFDDLHGIMEMERALTGGLAPAGAYETARLTRSAASMTEGAITLGAPKVQKDGSHKFVGQGLQQILAPVVDRLDDFLLYAVGRSASELMQQGREHLFSAAEIKAMLALETPEFRKAFDGYQKWNSAILDFAEAKGVINPMQRVLWKRFDYLPFHRVGSGPGGSQGVQGNFSGIKALTGGTDNIRDVLTNIIGNAHMLISAGLKNEARLKVANLAKQQGGARFMAQIPTDERAVRVSKDEVSRAILAALGVRSVQQLPDDMQAVVDQIATNMDAFVTFILRNQVPTGDNVVAVLRGGKPEFYEVADPLLYSALTALDRKAQHWIVRALGWPKRIGQLSVTLTADFLAANFFRDTLTGTIMSRHGFLPLIDSAKGLKSRLLADQNYRDFIANGGGLASHLLDEENLRVHLERFYTRKGIDYRTVLDAPSKLLLAAERIADSIEMATRIGEYGKAVARGENPRHAAYSAREVSTDFAMRGDNPVAGFAFDTIVFLKAAANGLDRLYRGVAHDPNRGKIAALTGLLALSSMALYAVNRGNPLYDQLEDWDRDTHWHFFIPRPGVAADAPADQRYWHFRLPKIWEIGAVASVAERLLEGFLNGQPLEAQKKSLKVIADVFSLEWMPQVIAPLYELATNRDRFTGRQIETQAMQELEPWARSNVYTSPTIRFVGEATRDLPRGMQLSPAQIEHLLEGYFNTWALYGLTLTDGALFDDAPDMRLDQTPVLRRFYREEPARNTRYITELYDAIEAAIEARRTLRAMVKRSEGEVLDERKGDIDNLLYPMLTRADKKMRQFRGQMQHVYGTSDLIALQDYATQLGRAYGDDRFVGRAKMTKAWGDLGALKLFVIDEITRHRNAFAEMAMGAVNARRAELSAEVQ